MKTTAQSSTSASSSKQSDHATPWAFYFLMALLGVGLLFMLGLLLFSF